MRDVKNRTEAQLIQDALEVVGWNRNSGAWSYPPIKQECL